MIKKSSWKYDYDNNHELEPVGLLKNGVLQVLSSWENQTVLQCLKHHRKNCFTFNMIFVRTKNGMFRWSNLQRDFFLLMSEKRKTFYKIILANRFYYVGKKEHSLRIISVTMKKNLVKSDMVKHELRVTSYELKA